MMQVGMFEQTRKFVDEAESVENWNHEELLQVNYFNDVVILQYILNLFWYNRQVVMYGHALVCR